MAARSLRRRPRMPAVVAAAVLGVLAGCGSADPELLDESVRATLHARVDDIRAALGDPRRAADAIEDFRAEVRRLRDSEELDAGDARVLLAQAAQIKGGLEAEPASPAPAPVVVEPPKGDGDGKDEGKEAEEERRKAEEERKRADEERKKAGQEKKKGGGGNG